MTRDRAIRLWRSRVVQLAEPLPETPSPAARRIAIPWVAIAWACGFAGVALIRLRGWMRVRAAVRASTPVKLSAAVECVRRRRYLNRECSGSSGRFLLLPEGIAEKSDAGAARCGAGA